MSVDHLAGHQRREVGIAPQAQDGLRRWASDAAGGLSTIWIASASAAWPCLGP